MRTNDFSDSQMLAIWQTLSARRANFDAMMWQTPALGMTAQAFLLTLALSPGTRPGARLMVAGLSFTLSIMVLQLMAKHRKNELLDSFFLESLETRLGMSSRGLAALPDAGNDARPREHLDGVRYKLKRTTPGARAFWDFSSYELWMLGLALFAIASLVIIALVVTRVSQSVLGT
jgi:hypothetical protein